MNKCRRQIRCSVCASRDGCPAAVRREKDRWNPKSKSASIALLRKAACELQGNWLTVEDLGRRMYGEAIGRKARMSIMVRARRAVNRLREMGLTATRVGPRSAQGRYVRGVPEYTVLPECLEVLGV